MMSNTFKRFLCAAMALLMLVTLLPAGVITAEAADNDQPIDTAIIFTDLHSTKSSYKESTISAVFGQIKKAGLPVSSVTSGGDAFSVNENNSSSNGPYDGYVSKINTSIRNALGNTGLPVNYVWSDHDRCAYQEDGTTLLNKTSHLVYGSGDDTIYGNDNDANYYVYALSMGDLCSYDRYAAGFNTDNGNSRSNKGFTASVDDAIANFKADAAKLKKDRPLFIVSHQPLFDNRNDNAFAEQWFDAINEVAKEMDVAFFYGHNHKYDSGNDYYYAKNSSMPVTTITGWNGYQTGSGTSYTKGDPKPTTKALNFTHLCAGYLSPATESGTTRQGTVMAVNIYDDSIQFVTYNSSGIYTGDYAQNQTVKREHNHTHTFSEENKQVTLEPTCTEEGSATYTCACGEKKAEPIPALGHSLTSTVTAPTCSTGGYTTYACANCDFSEQKDPTDALGHSYAESNSATCTANGFIVYTCTTCQHSYNGSATEAIGHNYSSTVTAPTCGNAGFTTYVCGNCGDTYTGNEVSALGHNYSAAVTEATCTQNGYTTYTCGTCGHSYVGNEVLASGHAYNSVVTEPTAETEGYTTHTCSICGDVKIDSFVPVLNHTYETVTVNATCTTNGSVTHTCTVCGYYYVEVLEAPGHKYTTVTTDATCTVNGSIVSTCATCGNVVRETIPAPGHKFESTTIEPTCTETGFTTYTCDCGHVETLEIAATGHDFSVVSTTDATCTNPSTTVYVCNTCSYRYTEQGAVLGHTFTTAVVAPTCTLSGYTSYICTDCGHRYNDTYVSSLGHNYEAAIVAPTCTANGYTIHSCTRCNDSFKDAYVTALGHVNTATVTAPTCTEMGYTTYHCNVCGNSSQGDYVSATGHGYSYVESNGYWVYTCKTCGDSYSVEVERDNTYNKVTKFTNNENYVITLYSNKKYYALSHKSNKITAVEVTVSNNEITSDITADLLWNYNNKKLSYKTNGKTYYLHTGAAVTGAPPMKISTSSSTNITFSSSKLKVSSYYLCYKNNAVSLNSSATTTYLFQEK